MAHTAHSAAAEPPLAAPPRRARFAVAYTFAAAGALTGAWAPRIPEVKQALGLGTGALGLALLAPAAGSLLAMPLAGAGAVRWGSRRMTRVLLAAFCLLPGLVGLAWSLWSLWIALFVWGSTIGALDVVMNAQAVSVEKVYRRPVMASFHAGFSIGTLTGAGLGSVGAAWGVPVGWQLAVLGGALLAVGWPLSAAFVGDPASHGPSSRMFALPSGRLLLLGVGTLACFLCEGAAADWSAVYLRESLDASAGLSGVAFAAFGLAMTTGRLVGDRVTAWLGPVRTVRMFTTVGAIGLAAGLLTGTVLGAIVGFGLFGLGLSCVVPIMFSAAGHGPGAAGSSLAAVATCGYSGWLLGPTVVGGLATVVGLAAALWLLPALTALTGVLGFAARGAGEVRAVGVGEAGEPDRG